MTALLRDAAECVVGVRVRNNQEHSTDLHATLTVGADGVRSTVAQQVDAGLSRQGNSAGGVLYRYFRDLPAEGYEWFYGDKAATGLIPTNDATCVFVGATHVKSVQVQCVRAHAA